MIFAKNKAERCILTWCGVVSHVFSLLRVGVMFSRSTRNHRKRWMQSIWVGTSSQPLESRDATEEEGDE